MNTRRSAVLVAVLLGVGSLAWLLHLPALTPVSTGRDDSVERTERHRRDVTAADRRDAMVDALRTSNVEVPAESKPKSLRGTDVDGALPVDANGHLIVTPSVRQFFDYFFVATGEARSGHIRATIIAEIEVRLDDPARGEAIDLLGRYLDYRKSGRKLMEEGDVTGDLTARLEEIRQLRRTSLGEANAEALFADEEARDYVAVAAREIAGDPGISEAERTLLLEGLEAQRPEAERAARAAATGPLRLAGEEAELRDQGAAAEEIRSLREERFGPEAADRLADLDRRRAAWQERVDDYHRQREAIAADPSLDGAQRERAIDALLAERFSETEQLRVRVLDRIRVENAESLR